MENKKNNEDLIKMLCYLGIFVLLLFIVLPPLFRVIFPEEEKALQEETEQKKTIMNLTCVKTEDFVEYQIKTTISTNYIEEKISNSTFIYEVEYMDEIFNSDDILIEEYERLKGIDNVDFYEEDNKYTLNIDYIAFDYSNEQLLTSHKMIIVNQMNFYSNDNFECNTRKVQ